MAVSQWMNELLLGMEPFDTEHKGLFQLIDDLDQALRARQADAVLDILLEELENYTKTHFLHEEELFSKIAYPKMDEHTAEHLRFTNDIASFRQDLFQVQVGLPVKVSSYLRDWLRTHIKVKDKDYGDFAREHGFA